MSNSLFVHDLKFGLGISNEVYCQSGLDEKYFDRFFDSGYSSVKILSRVNRRVVNKDQTSFNNQNIRLSKACPKNYLGLLTPHFYYQLYLDVKQCQLVVISTPSVLGAFTTLFCWLLRKPYTVEVAGDGDAFSSKKGGRIVSAFFNFMMPYFVSRAKGAAYVSKFLADKFPNKHTSVVASNVNIVGIHPKSPLANVLLENETVKIGFVGGLNKRKGVDILLQAASKLIIDYGYQNLQFNLVGGNSDFDLEAMLVEFDLSEHVVLHGLKPKSEVLELMKGFDLYVQPSLSEGLPRASLEAMSCALPVIATKLPGFYEILSNDALVDPCNVADLANRIESFLSSEILCNEHSSRNLKIASGFLYDTLHQKRCRYYHSFIENS